MFKQNAGLGVLLCTVLVAWACADTTVPTEIPLQVRDLRPNSSLGVVGSLEEHALEDVARVFALALADPQQRSEIRNAMRASPLTEHKLALQHYLATASGQRLIDAAAAAADITPGALRRTIARLPEMDFYLPFREHRLRWRATADVVVVGLFDVDALEYRGYSPDGAATTFETANGAPDAAVLLIQPAETKGRRVHPQPARPGDVVQDPGDGEWSGRIIWINQVGDSTTVDFADSMALTSQRIAVFGDGYCDPETAIIPCNGDDGSGPVYYPADTTRIDYFKVYFGDGIGSAEIEYRAHYYDANGNKVGSRVYRQEGVHKNQPNYPGLPLIFARVREGSTERIHIDLVETDWLSDDHEGSVDVRYQDRNATIYTGKMVGGCFTNPITGEWVCNPATPKPTSELRLDWTPKP